MLFLGQCPAQLGKDLLILREDHLVNFGGLLGAGDFFIPPIPFAGNAPNQLFAFQPLQKLGHRRMGHMLDALQIVLVDFRFPGSLQTADGTQHPQLHRCQTQCGRLFIQLFPKSTIDNRDF